MRLSSVVLTDECVQDERTFSDVNQAQTQPLFNCSSPTRGGVYASRSTGHGAGWLHACMHARSNMQLKCNQQEVIKLWAIKSAVESMIKLSQPIEGSRGSVAVTVVS